MALSPQKIIPTSFIRLVPAAISMLATFITVSVIGKKEYGLMSVLLATSSGINSVLFHWARNLITFEHNLKISRDSINNAWISSLILLPLPLAILIFSDSITFIDSLLILNYLFFQSLFEREIEFLRKNLDLKSYLTISCSRPLINILAIFILFSIFPASGIFRGCFFILGISPLISILILNKKFSVPNFMSWNLQSLKIIPYGIMITIPLSYIFLQDAVFKFISVKILPPSSFGEFAVFSDLSLSVSWVIISAFCWDFAPLAQSHTLHLKDLFYKKLFAVMTTGIFVSMILYFVGHPYFSKFIPLKLILADQYFIIFLNHFLAGLLSSLIFVGMILRGERATPLILAFLGLIMMFLNLNYFFKDGVLVGAIMTNGLIALISLSLFIFKNSIPQR